MRKFLFLTMIALAGCSDWGTGPEAENKLSVARARWEQSAGDDYRFTLDYGCFCGVSPRSAIIEVRDGAIVSVLDESTGAPPSQVFGMRSIPDLFDQIEHALDSDEASVSASYDANIGYPKSASIDYLPNAIDDEVNFGVREVVILD